MSGAGRGPRTCASSTTAPRPTLKGKPWSERKRYVWWDASREQVDKPRRLARLPADKAPDYEPEEDATATGGDRAATSRSSCTLTGAAGCIAPAGWSTGRCRPITSRTSRRSRTCSTSSSSNPTRQQFARPENPYNPAGERARRGRVPVRAHDLPADRAPHRRRHVAQRALPGRAAAGVLLRGLARARGRARPRTRRLGDDRDRPHRDRGARARNRADQAAAVQGRAVHQVGRPITGEARGSSPATRPTSCCPVVLDSNVHI